MPSGIRLINKTYMVKIIFIAIHNKIVIFLYDILFK